MCAALVLGACASRGTPRAPGIVIGEPPIQALLRAEVSDGAEHATVRLTLRRWRADRFELDAADVLGRRLWSVEVAGEGGVWADARTGQSCRLRAEGPVRFGSLEVPLPPRALPAVLLGAAPFELPDGPTLATTGGETLDFSDAEGHHWHVVRDGPSGTIVDWSLELAAGGALHWERRGEKSRLQSLRPPLVIEWREASRELLARPATDWSGPGDEVPECGDEELP